MLLPKIILLVGTKHTFSYTDTPAPIIDESGWLEAEVGWLPVIFVSTSMHDYEAPLLQTAPSLSHPAGSERDNEANLGPVTRGFAAIALTSEEKSTLRSWIFSGT